MQSNTNDSIPLKSALWSAMALAALLALAVAPIVEADENSAESTVAGARIETLTGSWKLNEKESDHPAASNQHSRSGARRGGFSGGIGAGSRGGSEGGKGGGRLSGSIARGSRPSDPASPTLSNRLTIVRSDDELIVVDGDGRERSIFTDGREMTLETPQGEITTSAAWNGGALVISRIDDDLSGSETFRVDEEGRLVITTSRPATGNRPAFEMRRVYDRQSA